MPWFPDILEYEAWLAGSLIGVAVILWALSLVAEAFTAFRRAVRSFRIQRRNQS